MPLVNYSQACRDGTFGPAVPPIPECRGGFDFTGMHQLCRCGFWRLTWTTVTFEESVFSIGPACLLLVFFPWRFISLRRKTLKTRKSWIHGLKLVGNDTARFRCCSWLTSNKYRLYSRFSGFYKPLSWPYSPWSTPNIGPCSWPPQHFNCVPPSHLAFYRIGSTGIQFARLC